MRALVIYHGRCPDGVAAAWCARKYFSEFLNNVEVEYYPAVHNKPPPFKRISRADNTYIVDFSYPREDLEKISTMTKLKVLDHHKSAEAQCEGLDFCEFDMERSGAGMAWDFFFPEEERPWLIDFIEDRDIWRWKWPVSEPVLAYLDTFPIAFETYDKAFDGEITIGQCREGGEAILRYIDQYNNETIQAGLRYITFKAPNGDVHTGIPVVNASHWGTSKLVNQISIGHAFGLGCFQRDDGKWKYSARVGDGDFDVSVLAAQYGGGGHAKASGFTLDAQLEEL